MKKNKLRTASPKQNLLVLSKKRGCKTKTIQTNLGTFRHNQTYPEITQVYLEPFLTLTYLKLWYIQNPNIRNQKYIQNPGIFRTLLYSEPRYIQNAGIFKI